MKTTCIFIVCLVLAMPVTAVAKGIFKSKSETCVVYAITPYDVNVLNISESALWLDVIPQPVYQLKYLGVEKQSGDKIYQYQMTMINPCKSDLCTLKPDKMDVKIKGRNDSGYLLELCFQLQVKSPKRVCFPVAHAPPLGDW